MSLKEFVGIFVKAFKDVLDALDTPGGHILICVVMIFTGVGVSMAGYEVGGKLLEFLGILAMVMRGRDKANGKPADPPSNPINGELQK